MSQKYYMFITHNITMSGLCRYKDILGIPGKGIHSYRIFNVAIMDVIMTVIASYIISLIFRISFLWSFVFLFILGEILHYVFCVPTTIMKLLGFFTNP
jgi:hypothetical protein